MEFVLLNVLLQRAACSPPLHVEMSNENERKKAESLNNSSKVKVVGCELQFLIVAHLDETSPSTDKNDN